MLKAVIFDLDGTILINDTAYDLAFGAVLETLGVSVDSGFSHTGGIGVRSNWENFIKKYQLSNELSLDQLEQQTQAAYVENFKNVTLRNGFFELINALQSANIKTALATGNDAETTEVIIDHFDMHNCFEVISTIYESGHPKPAPDIFLLAATRLNVAPSQCIVIEDSPAGIEAARQANMPVVSIHEHAFTELSLEKLQSLYKLQ